MNGRKLLTALGGVEEKYIQEAEFEMPSKVMKGKFERKQAGRRKMWKFILIAAAMSLLLTGCAVVYALRLESMKMATEDLANGERAPDIRTVLSLQGPKGSDGYNAAMEWYDFLQTYDQDHAIYDSLSNQDMIMPEEYYAYRCYTREMTDKIDEICAKYNLQLHGRHYMEGDVAGLYEAVGIRGILREGLEIQDERISGYFFRDGSFNVEGHFTVSGENPPWPYPISFSYRCNMKNAFDDVYASLRNIEQYEQWDYTTKNGIPVLLALGPKGAIITADRPDHFIYLALSNDAAGHRDAFQMDRTQLEGVAEFFDFSIAPQPVSDEAAAASDQRREEYEARWMAEHYKGRENFDALMKSCVERNPDSVRMGYLMVDLNGDGKDELLMGQDGYFSWLMVEKDDYVEQSTRGSGMYLCEGNVLASFQWEKGQPEYTFHRYREDWEADSVYLLYRPGKYADSDWRVYEGSHYIDGDTDGEPVTKEEYFRIAASYKRLTTDLVPVEQYPLPEPSQPGLKVQGIESAFSTYQDVFDFWRENTEDARAYAEEWGCEMEHPYQGSGFVLYDLDGDGQEELIQKADNGWIDLDTILNGKIKGLCSGRGLTLCKNGLILQTVLQSGSNKTVYGYRLENGRLTLVDYLRCDYDRNPASPWFRSADMTGQDISLEPITQEECDRVFRKYVPLELEYTSIVEFLEN